MKFKKTNYDKDKLKKILDEQFPEKSPEQTKIDLIKHELWAEENLEIKRTLVSPEDEKLIIKIKQEEHLRNTEHENWERNLENEKLKKEESEFKETLEICKKENDMESMYFLAKYYYEGTGVTKNYVEALYWINRAEELGDVDAPQLRLKIEEYASEIHKREAKKKLKQIIKKEINYHENDNYLSGGHVYIFTCTRWENSIKIGKTNNLNRRLEEAQEEIKGTYSPRPPKVEIYFSQYSKNYHELERRVHSELSKYRVSSEGKGKEFFDLSPDEAIETILRVNKEV